MITLANILGGIDRAPLARGGLWYLGRARDLRRALECARRFIDSAPLTKFTPKNTPTNENRRRQGSSISAFVLIRCVAAVSAALSTYDRMLLFNCLNLAQLFASNKSDQRDLSKWMAAYLCALARLGWQVPNDQTADLDSSGQGIQGSDVNRTFSETARWSLPLFSATESARALPTIDADVLLNASELAHGAFSVITIGRDCCNRAHLVIKMIDRSRTEATGLASSVLISTERTIEMSVCLSFVRRLSCAIANRLGHNAKAYVRELAVE